MDKTLIVCRPEFADALRDELQDRHFEAQPAGAGLVLADGIAVPPVCIFERQRLPRAGFVPVSELKPIADSTFDRIMAGIAAHAGPWTTHAYVLEDNLGNRIEGIENTLLRLLAKRLPDKDHLYRPPHRIKQKPDAAILQLCLTAQGLWFSTAKAAELSHPEIGGISRMKFDPDAPSRSYLKIEEAFTRLNRWPQQGERAVDLGAAPGGWTHAFLKRGCPVIAVDNGPMKLATRPDFDPLLRHVRENGLTYAPPADWQPVDWLVADMLVAPGAALGFLRTWISNRWMKQFVVNIKIPQQQPYPAIKPVLDYLNRHVEGYATEVRQLYHDRREVTILGQARATS